MKERIASLLQESVQRLERGESIVTDAANPIGLARMFVDAGGPRKQSHPFHQALARFERVRSSMIRFGLGGTALSRPPADELIEWLVKEGIGVLPSVDALLLIDDGEAQFAIRRNGEEWLVHKTLRDVEQGVQLRSGRWEDVEKFVLMLYVDSVRASHGLGSLRPRAQRDAGAVAAPAPGCELTGDHASGFELLCPDGHVVWFASDVEAVSFSAYAGHSAAELRAESIAPDSSPFSDEVLWDGLNAYIRSTMGIVGITKMMAADSEDHAKRMWGQSTRPVLEALASRLPVVMVGPVLFAVGDGVELQFDIHRVILRVDGEPRWRAMILAHPEVLAFVAVGRQRWGEEWLGALRRHPSPRPVVHTEGFWTDSGVFSWVAQDPGGPAPYTGAASEEEARLAAIAEDLGFERLSSLFDEFASRP